MARLQCAAFAAIMLAADVPTVHRFRPETTLPAAFPAGETLPVLPDLSQTSQVRPSQDAPKSDRLDERARIEILREISGEFARAVRSLPSGKNGFHIKVGKPLDESLAERAVAAGGSAAGPGDQIQITRIEFHDRSIVIDINGGGRQHTRLRDRIHLQVSGMPTARVDQPGPAGLQKIGSTLYLDFERRVPAVTPQQLKQYLSAFLDFTRQRSAAVQWVETLPPEMQQAIKDKRPLVGMDQEMVIAAMGRPGKKVRERDETGLETEDWIYGHPPGRTVFVKFAGDKVISVKQF